MYDPVVATVANVGIPDKSPYAPEVATVANEGVPLKELYAPSNPAAQDPSPLKNFVLSEIAGAGTPPFLLYEKIFKFILLTPEVPAVTCKPDVVSNIILLTCVTDTFDVSYASSTVKDVPEGYAHDPSADKNCPVIPPVGNQSAVE